MLFVYKSNGEFECSNTEEENTTKTYNRR